MRARSPIDTFVRRSMNLAKLNVLDYDATSDRIYEQLKLQRVRVGSQDLRIAAIALANNCTLVTRNKSDFSKVPV